MPEGFLVHFCSRLVLSHLFFFFRWQSLLSPLLPSCHPKVFAFDWWASIPCTLVAAASTSNLAPACWSTRSSAWQGWGVVPGHASGSEQVLCTALLTEWVILLVSPCCYDAICGCWIISSHYAGSAFLETLGMNLKFISIWFVSRWTSLPVMENLRWQWSKKFPLALYVLCVLNYSSLAVLAVFCSTFYLVVAVSKGM